MEPSPNRPPSRPGGGSGTAGRRPWGVIFDMDGTLVDNTAHHEAAWIEFGRRHRLPITAEFYRGRIHAHDNREIAAALFGGAADGERARRMEEEKEAIYQELYRPHLRERPGLTPLLEALRHAGVPCALASNSPRTNVDFVLDGLGLRPYFASVASVSDIPRGKPAPDLFFESARRMGVVPARCVVVEDSASGIEAARRAQMPLVLISDTPRPEAPCHADFTTLTVEGLSKRV